MSTTFAFDNTGSYDEVNITIIIIVTCRLLDGPIKHLELGLKGSCEEVHIHYTRKTRTHACSKISKGKFVRTFRK